MMPVSICLIIRDEGEYLPEWLEWHIGQGVEHFWIYDNGSAVPIGKSIPGKYARACTVIPFGGKHKRAQVDAYNDCLARSSHKAAWMAFIDTDEFIRVVDGRPLPVFLSTLPKDADALAMHWIIYNASGLIHKDHRPVRERFKQVTDRYPTYFPQCKCIVRTDRVRLMEPHMPVLTGGIHVVNERGGSVRSLTDPAISCDIIAVDHYFTRSFEEWEEKMRRGSCDPLSCRRYEEFKELNPDMEELIP